MSIEKMIDEVTKKKENIKSLREVVLEFLREAIFSGYFKPGDHLVERELSELLDISTTPIKEAFRILEHEGLVKTVPRKGTYVSEILDTSIEEVMMLRAVLEGFAVNLAAKKITDEEMTVLERQIKVMKELTEARDAEKLVEENYKFHQLIREAAKSPMILKMVNNVVAFDNAFRKRALKNTLEIEEGFQEHYAIFKAIVNRNGTQAEQLMKNHIMRTVTHVLGRS